MLISGEIGNLLAYDFLAIPFYFLGLLFSWYFFIRDLKISKKIYRDKSYIKIVFIKSKNTKFNYWTTYMLLIGFFLILLIRRIVVIVN